MRQLNPQFIAIIKAYILQNSGKVSIVDSSQEKAGFSEIDNDTSLPNRTIFLFRKAHISAMITKMLT